MLLLPEEQMGEAWGLLKNNFLSEIEECWKED
jgi:hypothetical protein